MRVHACSQFYNRCDARNIYQVHDELPIGTIAIRDDKPANTTNIMGCLNDNW